MDRFQRERNACTKLQLNSGYRELSVSSVGAGPEASVGRETGMSMDKVREDI